MSSTGLYKWKAQPSPFFGTLYVPVCVLSVLDCRNEWRDVEAIVDSGAVVTLLKRSFGDLLGLDVPSGRPLRLSGVGSAAVDTFVHDLRICVGGITMTVPVAIASDDSPPNLVGRAGLFDSLVVAFSGPAKITSFSH